MANASKRIPVTAERLKALDELKEDGQTYDELLEELIVEHERRELAQRAREEREVDREDLTSLDEL